MTKQEFLDKLEAGLAGTNEEEQVLEFYREMIADRVEDGMSEEEAVAQVGTVEEILASCVQSVTVVPRQNTEQTGEIRRVVIREREFDIQILPTEEPCYRLEGQDRYHEVCLENGTLRILRNKEPLPRRLFSSQSGEMTLYLPRGCYESLDITTASGNMEIQQDFASVRVSGASSDITLSGTFGGRVDIQTASGDVELNGVFGDTLQVQTASGDVALTGRFSGADQVQTRSGEIEAREAGFGSIGLRTASGDVALHNVLADTLEIHCASGDLDLNRVCGQTLVLESKSGDMDLMDTLSKGSFRCKTVSGDMELRRVDGPDMDLETVSGDISGFLLHGKHFTTRTVSGDFALCGGTPEGNCRIVTVSGDVRLGLAEEP